MSSSTPETVRAPRLDYITPFEDSRKWLRFAPRPDDIVIATPPKSGTTWTQGIVRSLLWPAGDAPGRIGELSPWIDGRAGDVDEIADRLAAQSHRRFVKTHSPADAIPVYDQCRYVCVFRDGPDALVSWGNHRDQMRAEIGEVLNALSAIDDIAPIPTMWDGDWDDMFDEWIEHCSPVRLLASWWPLRGHTNVRLLHYADLVADLAGEMRKLARWLGIDVPASAWPDVVGRCRIDAMRTEADAAGGLEHTFRRGAASFYHRGGNGRGRAELPDHLLRRFEHEARIGLPPEARAWLAAGAASGIDPLPPPRQPNVTAKPDRGNQQ